MQLHQPDVLNALAALDARLVVVSFAEVERLRRWVPYFRRQFLEPAFAARGYSAAVDPFERTRFLADPARTAYHAYGLGRNSVWRVYGPRILAQYARWGLQGRPIRVNQDTLQRGGNFVIGPGGRLTLAHTGRDQSERPSIGAILAALRQG